MYFSEIMSVGSSLSWREVLKIATSGKSNRLDIRPMLEYFKPLRKWLEIQNQNESVIGWSGFNIEGRFTSYFDVLSCKMLLN